MSDETEQTGTELTSSDVNDDITTNPTVAEVGTDVNDDILPHRTDATEVTSDVNADITGQPAEDADPDVFPREVVEKLRQEKALLTLPWVVFCAEGAHVVVA